MPKAQRAAVGDLRASLEERYGTHAAFVDRIRIAATQMAVEGFLLVDDLERIVTEAENSSVLKVRSELFVLLVERHVA